MMIKISIYRCKHTFFVKKTQLNPAHEAYEVMMFWLVLKKRPFNISILSSGELNGLSKFSKGHHKEHFSEFVLNFD